MVHEHDAVLHFAQNRQDVYRVARVFLNVAAFNANLNSKQWSAVQAMIGWRGTSPSPMILVGPPGTGKTTTVTEMIIQALLLGDCRVLAAAPSNHAADLLASQLADRWQYIPGAGDIQSEVFRMNAFMRGPKSLPAVSILQWLCRYSNGAYVLPTPAELMQFRVVLCTCTSASYLESLGMPHSHFTHLIVDEAGESTVGECLIPLQLAGGSKPCIVLAGDPKQLGPVIRSPLAQRYGLGVSLLERTVAVREREHDSAGVTQLVQNYRAHSDIVSLYSQLFYGGLLRPCAPAAVANRMLVWPQLSNPKSPILFRHVEGEEARDEDSPSWHNPTERAEVLKLIYDLLRSRLAQPSDIGVITPYQKQMQKIRGALHYNTQCGFPPCDDIRVGATELFQGTEKPVILISTVRSTCENLHHDRRYLLGFVASPKRMNVAISRAQSLLVIVGNAKLLTLDPLWQQLLHHIQQLGCYQGPPLNFKEQGGAESPSAAPDEAWSVVLGQNRSSTDHENAESEDDGGNQDAPWRSDM